MKEKTHVNICFDFDGVIHSYVSGRRGIDIIPDPMVSGIGNVIRNLKSDGYKIIIFTTRASQKEGYEAVRKYLNRRHIPFDSITDKKVPALCYIDDRSICFNGNVKDLYDKIKNFRPWTNR